MARGDVEGLLIVGITGVLLYMAIRALMSNHRFGELRPDMTSAQ